MKFSKYNLIVPSPKKEQFFLFNTFNGSCFEIDKQTAEMIKGKELENLSPESKELLALSGALIPDNVNEDHKFAYLQGHYKYNTSNFTSTVLLTWDCNLKCPYCFQGHDREVNHMTMEQADRYINFTLGAVAQKNSKSVFIMLFGGEPLMNIDIGIYILEKIKAYCDENSIMFTSGIVTNGTLLTLRLIETLCNLNCKMIQITLDGVKDIHDTRRMYGNGDGSFDDIMNILRVLNEQGRVHTIIRINVDRTNIDDTYDLLTYLGKDGESLTNCTVDFGIVRTEGTACAGYSTNCFSEIEIGDVLYDLWGYAEKQGFRYKIKPNRRFFYCGLYCDNQYTIASNLDVYKCWEHVGNPIHLMGRIDENGRFVDQTHAFFEWMSVDPLKNDTCKACVYLPTCGGGCGVIAYNETGSYHAKGCFKVRGTVEKQVLKFVEGIMKPRENVEKCGKCNAKN